MALDQPTADGDTTLRLWSNLPGGISAGQVAELYRTRWRVERKHSPGIEAMFGRLEAVLNSELASLGHPRAALLGFTVAVLAFNVLALLGRCVKQAHQQHQPPLEVSTFHLALLVRGSYEGMLIALPFECWPPPEAAPAHLAKQLLALARHVSPRAVAIRKRGPKPKTPKGYVDGKTARSQAATARVLARAKSSP